MNLQELLQQSEMHPERLVALSYSFGHFAEGIFSLIFSLFSYNSRDEMPLAKLDYRKRTFYNFYQLPPQNFRAP